MSGGGGSGKSETTTEPWAGQEPYLKTLFSQAQSLLPVSKAPDVYPNPSTVPFNANELAAQKAALGESKLQGQTAANTTGGLNFLLDPSILSPDSNKYLAATGQAAARPIYEQLTQSVLPSIRSGMQGAGIYGSNRQGIAEGLAAKGADQAAADAMARIYSDAYGQGLTALERGVALAPGVQAMQTVPSQTIAGVGAQQRDYAQAIRDQQIANWNYQQQLPYTQLAQYQNFIQGGYGGQTQATTQGGGVNPLMSGMGGAMGGAALGTMLGGPGVGTGVGAGAGALLGLFGAY